MNHEKHLNIFNDIINHFFMLSHLLITDYLFKIKNKNNLILIFI
jgi:hypothetical protein